MYALTLSSGLRTAQVTLAPVPHLSDGELLVRVHAVALNPVDALYVFNPLGATGQIVGSDFAGVIERIDSRENSAEDGVPKLSTGTRVAGFVQGASSVNPRPGAFAAYVAVPQDLVWIIPDSMSFAEAASISLCGLIAAQALFEEKRLGLCAPWKEDDGSVAKRRTILIYGASTSVALYTVQLIRKCKGHFTVIGCASSKHFHTLNSEPYCYGELIDYRSDWQSELENLIQDTGIDLAYDCISEGETVQKVSRMLNSGAKMAIVRSAEGGAWTSEDNLPVRPSYGAVWEGLGEEVQYQGMTIPPNLEAKRFTVQFYKWLSVNGPSALQPNKIRVMPGGLDRIVDDGFRLLGSGSMSDRVVDHQTTWMQPISAEKLVYMIGT